MESSKEQIEAQLCAYIDGELDDAQRAEIERHLATNPQHKSLIAELRRHSGLLQDLPKANAPLELNEAVCGQLERSSLLNPSQDEATQTLLSINRWPQITAVAAVLLLALGLGIVVYYVLPPSSSNPHNNLALDEKNAKNPVTDGGVLDKEKMAARKPAKPENAESRDITVQSDKSARDKTVIEHPFDLQSAEIKDGRLITAREVEDLRRANVSLRASNQTFNFGSTSLCLVVSTTDTATANSQVASYFKTNNIHYMNYEESVALAEGVGYRSDVNAPIAGLGSVSDGAKERYSDRVDSHTLAAGKGVGGGLGGGGGVEAGVSGGRGGASAPAAGSVTGNTLEQIAEGRRPAEGRAMKARAAEATLETKRFSDPLATAPAPAGNAAAPAKPGSQAEAAKLPSKTEDQSVKSDRDLSSYAALRKSEQNTQQQGADEPRAKDSADFRRANSERELSAPKSDPRDSTPAWQLQNDAIRARIAGQIPDDGIARNGVIIARMNRRQASELSESLSRELGQRAELTNVNLSDLAALGKTLPASEGSAKKSGPGESAAQFGLATVGEPSAAPTPNPGKELRAFVTPSDPSAGAAFPTTLTPARLEEKQHSNLNGAATRPILPVTKDAYNRLADEKPTNLNGEPSNSLSLRPDPMDEPVYVYILVKGAPTPGVPSLQVAPKSSTDSASPADTKK